MKKILKKIVGKLRKIKGSNSAGFTLTELLTVIIMGSIIVSSVLFLAVDVSRNNRREIAQTVTQEEIKRALNYIAQDLRSAVYVYNGQQLENRGGSIPGLIAHLPQEFTENGTQPILAFWKVDRVPYASDQTIPNCNNITDVEEQQQCRNLRVERRAYSLVVYLQSTDNSNDIWSGESRILRYELRKYVESNLTAQSTTLSNHQGYQEPRRGTNFKNWPYNSNGANLQTELPNGTQNKNVLVDFIAMPNDTSLGNPPDCPSNEYVRSPSNPDESQSFFACVRQAENDLGDKINQDVFLYLQGNANGHSGLNQDSFLPVIKTQVMNRGVIEKTVRE